MLGCAGPWCSPAEALNAPLWENPQGTAQPCSLSIHKAAPKHCRPQSAAVLTSLKTKCASLHRCSRTEGIPRNSRSTVLFLSCCWSSHCLQISISSCHCPNCIPWPSTGEIQTSRLQTGNGCQTEEEEDRRKEEGVHSPLWQWAWCTLPLSCTWRLHKRGWRNPLQHVYVHTLFSF